MSTSTSTSTRTRTRPQERQAWTSAPAPAVPGIWQAPRHTAAFTRDAAAFLQKQRDAGPHPDVFYARILHWTVLITASYRASRDALSRTNDFRRRAAMLDFPAMGVWHDQSVFLLDGQEAIGARKNLAACPGFRAGRHERVYNPRIDAVVDRFVKTRLMASKRIVVYDAIKTLAVDVLAHTVLGLPLADEARLCNVKGTEPSHLVHRGDELRELTTDFWRAMTSSGFKFGGFVSSLYGKGLDAKDTLQAMFEALEDTQTLADPSATDPHGSCPYVAAHLVSHTDMDRDERVRNLTIMTSGLAHKTLASLTVSTVYALLRHPAIVHRLHDLVPPGATASQVSPEAREYLRCVLMEAERLYPPVLGQPLATEAEGVRAPGATFALPVGTRVWSAHLLANRDPVAFANPLEFRPERWMCSCAEPACVEQCAACGIKPHLSFGDPDSERNCMGKEFVRNVVLRTCLAFVANVDLSSLVLPEGTDQGEDAFRWLPVARPRSGLEIDVRPRGGR